MTALDQLTDPWGLSDAARSAPHRPWLRPLGAWALSLGVVLQLWISGGHRWIDVAVGAGAAALIEAAVRAGRGRGGATVLLRIVAVLVVAAGARAVIGTTPALLLVAVVVGADAAVVSWRPTRSWPARTVPTAGIAVGLLVAAQVAWIRSGSRAVVLALLLAAYVTVEVYGRWPRLARRADDALATGIRVVSSAVVHVVLAIVAGVVLYLPGAVVRLVRAPTARRRDRALRHSSWQPMQATVGDARRDAPWGFTSTPAPVRARRTAAGLAVVAVVAVVAVAVSRDARSSQGPVVPEELRIQSSAPTSEPVTDPLGRQVLATELAVGYDELPAYAGVPWADDLQRDEQNIVDGNRESKYVNIRNGRRVTLEPEACDCRRATLWLSGGSAAFGTGQRDEHTIASDLVRLAHDRDGIALEVENHSHDGYTFQMEDEWEIEQSLRTEDAPDLIVFYNGWNDVMAEVAQEYLRGPDPNRKMTMILPPDLDAINKDTEAFLASDVGVPSGKAAAARYLAVQERVDAAAEAAGAATAYFLQADAFAAPRQLADYQQINGIPTEQMLDSPLAVALDTMAETLGSNVVDLRGLFEDTEDPVFLGLVHQNEAGAQAVAEAMYEHLRPQIREAARRS